MTRLRTVSLIVIALAVTGIAALSAADRAPIVRTARGGRSSASGVAATGRSARIAASGRARAGATSRIAIVIAATRANGATRRSGAVRPIRIRRSPSSLH